MKVIQIEKKTNTKVQQLEVLLNVLCYVNGMLVSETDISILSHYVVYGIKSSTDKLILNSKIVNDSRQLRNAKCRLGKKGFLRRTSELYKSYELALSKDFKNDDVINLLIKLDNRE